MVGSTRPPRPGQKGRAQAARARWSSGAVSCTTIGMIPLPPPKRWCVPICARLCPGTCAACLGCAGGAGTRIRSCHACGAHAPRHATPRHATPERHAQSLTAHVGTHACRHACCMHATPVFTVHGCHVRGGGGGGVGGLWLALVGGTQQLARGSVAGAYIFVVAAVHAEPRAPEAWFVLAAVEDAHNRCVPRPRSRARARQFGAHGTASDARVVALARAGARAGAGVFC